MVTSSAVSPQHKLAPNEPMRTGADLSVPVRQIEGLSSPMLLPALLRQGFFVTNPDARPDDQQVAPPAKWRSRFYGASHQQQKQTELCVLQDPLGRPRAVIEVNADDPLQNRMSLVPRFAIAVVPAKGNQFEIQLDDGGIKHHRLAETAFKGRKRPKADVLAMAQHLAADVIPDIANPLVRWDMQSGHVKKQVGTLRLAFGATAGFVVPQPKASQREELALRPQERTPNALTRQEQLMLVREHEILAGHHTFDPREDEHPVHVDDFRVYKQGLGW